MILTNIDISWVTNVTKVTAGWDITPLANYVSHQFPSQQMPDPTSDITERPDPSKLRHLIFAEIPKTGSTSFANLLRNVSASNGWNWVTRPDYRYMKDDLTSEMRFIKKVFGKDLLSGNRTGFLAHIKFFDFERHDLENPVWFTVVRDPVERFISMFHYVRRPDRVRLSSHRRSKMWLNLTVDQCVETRSYDCNVAAGKNYEPSPITFLCGSKDYCAVHDSVRALMAAKSNVEKYFPVIAVLDYFREDDDIPWRQIQMLPKH